MFRTLRIGLAVALALAAWRPVLADPATPQLSPLHRQREDAQRLTEQQRNLDPVEPVDPATAPTPGMLSTRTRHTTRGAGLALLGVGGVATVLSLPLFAADTSGSGESDGTYATLAKVFLATGLVSAVAGIGLLAADRQVQVAPTVSPKAIGLAIMGRI